MKKLNDKIALINDATLPQGIEKVQKSLSDKIIMMSAKLDKKIKSVEKKFDNFTPAVAGAPAPVAEENQLKSFDSKHE